MGQWIDAIVQPPTTNERTIARKPRGEPDKGQHDREKPGGGEGGADGLAERSWIDPALSGDAGNSGNPLATVPGHSWIAPNQIERRLSERAETLWKKLCAGAPLPPERSLHELLRLPFLPSSLLVKIGADGVAQPMFAGEAVAVLVGLKQGADGHLPERPNATGARLIALAEKAARSGAPCRYETSLPRSAGAADPAGAEDGPHDHGQHDQMASREAEWESSAESSVEKSGETVLLLRAMAFPFAAAEDGVGAGEAGSDSVADSVSGPIVVVASWREMLSAEETRALHRELTAALQWMHRQEPR